MLKMNKQNMYKNMREEKKKDNKTKIERKQQPEKKIDECIDTSARQVGDNDNNKMKRRVYFFIFLSLVSKRNIGFYFRWSNNLEINKQIREKNKHNRQKIDFYIVADIVFVFFCISLYCLFFYFRPLLCCCCCLGVRCAFGPLLLFPPLTASDVGDVGPSPESNPLLFDDTC
jgi:hypothetical protein